MKLFALKIVLDISRDRTEIEYFDDLSDKKSFQTFAKIDTLIEVLTCVSVNHFQIAKKLAILYTK